MLKHRNNNNKTIWVHLHCHGAIGSSFTRSLERYLSSVQLVQKPRFLARELWQNQVQSGRDAPVPNCTANSVEVNNARAADTHPVVLSPVANRVRLNQTLFQLKLSGVTSSTAAHHKLRTVCFCHDRQVQLPVSHFSSQQRFPITLDFWCVSSEMLTNPVLFIPGAFCCVQIQWKSSFQSACRLGTWHTVHTANSLLVPPY